MILFYCSLLLPGIEDVEYHPGIRLGWLRNLTWEADILNVLRGLIRSHRTGKQ